MAEEQLNASTTGSETATSETPAKTTGVLDSQAAQTAATQAESVDWASVIEKANPEELRRHPRVAGIVGDMVQKAHDRWKREQEDAITRQKAEEAEARLQKLAEEDPVAFANQYLSKAQAEKVQRELAEVRSRTASDFAKAIGAAVAGLEEYKDLSQEDLAEIAAQLAGKAEHEVLGHYTVSMIKKLVAKGVGKSLEAEITKRLAKEKEAWRKEWEAERLTGEPAPDLAKPKPASKFDPAKLPPDKFNQWYEKEVLGRL